ncbi:MAG: pyruvate dehydrogenase component, partial [Solirubrobacteraceae bacterium]|nr:pyruvate dehydrogenase component [Solirubrobacteraceae bacterium]
MQHDVDQQETREWLEALDAVVEHDGSDRAAELLEALYAEARLRGLHPRSDLSSPYVNTIPVELQPPMPGDQELEQRIRSLVRWNAMAMVLQANKESSELGGHIASFQSAAMLYEVGFNHFWHAPSEDHGGDL